VKSGNKVTPGDKFDNDGKGGTVKDNEASVPTPAGDKVPTADAPAVASPKHGETDGSDASDSTASSAAAKVAAASGAAA
jgi:hypothetical protein